MLRIPRDAFISTVVNSTHLVSPNDAKFTSTHIKIVATKEYVRSYCTGDEICACAYVPAETWEPGTYYFARAALEAFVAKLTTEAVEIERVGTTNILRADQRYMEFYDPKKTHAFQKQPKSELENMETLSESDALMIQTVAQSAASSTQVSPEYHCVYALPVDNGTEIYAYNGQALAMGLLDKKLMRPVALPVALARMAKYGNLLVSDKEVGIEGPYCMYWCNAPVAAQHSFPLLKVQRQLNKEGTKVFEIDGRDMTAVVELLNRAFSAWEESPDVFFEIKGNDLRVRVQFPTTKFEEMMTVRGTDAEQVMQFSLKDHMRTFPALAKQSVVHVYNVGRFARFESDSFKLLLPLENVR